MYKLQVEVFIISFHFYHFDTEQTASKIGLKLKVPLLLKLNQ